ncbi:MAG: hypothetical protein ACK56I_20055, partial [bacterium]
ASGAGAGPPAAFHQSGGAQLLVGSGLLVAPVDDGLVRSSRLGSPGVGCVPGQRGGGEACLCHRRRLLLPPSWTVCPSGMVVVGGACGDPQG